MVTPPSSQPLATAPGTEGQKQGQEAAPCLGSLGHAWRCADFSLLTPKLGGCLGASKNDGQKSYGYEVIWLCGNTPLQGGAPPVINGL